MLCLMKRLNSRSLMIINTTPFPNSTGKGISLTLDICHTNSGEFLLLFSSRRSLQWDPKLKLKFRAAFVCSTSQSTRHPFILTFYSFFALRNCWNRCQIVVHFVFFVAFPLYLFSFPSWWWPLLFSFVLVHWLCAVSNFCEIPSPLPRNSFSGVLNRFAVLA